MKFCCTLIILAFLTLCTDLDVSAAPACPEPLTFSQPDGSQFQGRIRGNEWRHWVETGDSLPVVRNNSSGFWEYARLPEGAELAAESGLVPSGRIPGRDRPDGIRKISARDIRSSRPVRQAPSPAPAALSGAAKTTSELPAGRVQAEAGAPLNILGAQKALVILVNFADVKLSSTDAQWAAKVFSETTGVTSYFSEVSGNQFTISPAPETYGTINDGVVIVTLGTNHPGSDGNVTGTEKQQLAKDAILAANADVNFALFDGNSNGFITDNELHIIIVAAGYEESNSSGLPSIWGHKWTIQSVAAPVVDTKIVGESPGGYTMLGERQGNDGHTATIGVICHELGHDLGTDTVYEGLPDLYDTDYSSEGVGDWCLMGSGVWNKTGTNYSGTSPSHPSAWCKYYLGWLTPTRILPAQTGVDWPQVENAVGADRGVKQLLINPNGPEPGGGTGEYFLVENRQKTGYDAGLPGAGILIWHIDESQPDNNNENHKLVDLEEADGLNQLDDSINEGNGGDPYPGSSDNRSFDYSSDPNSRLYSGVNSRIGLRNISNSGPTMTADVVNLFEPTAVTLPATEALTTTAILNASVNPNDSNTTVYFEWGPTAAYGNSTANQALNGALSDTPVLQNISGLAAGTVYHFKVVASNGNGLSQGDDKTFSTLKELPDEISWSIPGNGESMVPLNQALSWSATARAERYDIYFEAGNAGTAFGAPVTTTSGTSYDPGPLQYNLLYHWRIDPKNFAGTVTGTELLFSTGPATGPSGGSSGGGGKGKCGLLGVEALIAFVLVAALKKRLRNNRG